MFALVIACSGVCVLAGLMALLATRLERMAVAVVVIGGAAAGLLVAVSASESSMTTTVLPTVGVLLAGAVAMAATVLGAMAVLEVDARPTRQLRPWKVLLLVPLFLLGTQLTSSSTPTASPPPPSAPEMPALALTLLTLAAAAVVVPLLVRRRESP